MNETAKAQSRLPGLDALLAAHRADTRPLPKSCVDANGQFVPESPEEARERKAAILKMLDEIGKITDETDTEEIWRDAMGEIEEGRFRRQLFAGNR